MSQSVYSKHEYFVPVRRDFSAIKTLKMSPDRGSFHHQQQPDDYKYLRYKDAKVYGYHDSLPRRVQLNPYKRNGFVYEDIYAKRIRSREYKSKYDCSSPYKPIRPEYLTLPSNFSKHSTLPKSWSVSSSNSYKSHFAPVHSVDVPLSPMYDYYKHSRNSGSRDLRHGPKYLSCERGIDQYRVYNEMREATSNACYKMPPTMNPNELPTDGGIVPWYMELENNRLKRARKIKAVEEQRARAAQKDAAYYEDKAGKQQRNYAQQLANADTINGEGRRNEYEIKKNVTFSEVRGCQDMGKQPTQVRELEVSFSQVVDKYNMVKDYQMQKQQMKQQQQIQQQYPCSEKGRALPNGYCVRDGGIGVQRNVATGKLPTKPGQSRGIILGLAKRKYLTQVMAALAVSLAPFAAGLGKGYSSPAIASLQQLRLRKPFNGSAPHDISVSDQQASWVASLSLLGALFGGVIGGVAMRHGRRKVLLVISLPFSLSWVLTVFATSVEMMFFTSFMGGFCCSVVTMVSQVYVSEISLPDIRGCLNAVLKIVGHLGVLMSFTVGAYLDWQQLAMFISIAPIILFCTMIYVPETPSYLVLNGKEEEAYKSLTWLRGPGSDIIKELATIRAHVLATKTFKNKNIHISGNNNWNALLTTRIAGPVLITCGLMLFQRFSGAHAFNFYAVPIFRKTFGGMNPHGGAIAVSFVQLLASCLSGLLIDTVGRLPLLIASSVFMSMALAGFGSYAYYEEVHRNQRLQNVVLSQTLGTAGQNDWIPLLCVLVFTIAFSLGMSPISWLLIGELFPLEFRGTGSALATAFSYLCAFVGVKTFVDFQQMFGLHGAFWLYAFISVGGLCFVVCCVPETKGRDLDEMDPKSVQELIMRR